MDKKLKVAFDVDYTLINEHYQPIHRNIDLFRWFEEQGHDMIIWSGGGLEYARNFASRLGLKARVIQKCSEEVDIAVDDMMDFGPAANKWIDGIKAKVVIRVNVSL